MRGMREESEEERMSGFKVEFYTVKMVWNSLRT